MDIMNEYAKTICLSKHGSRKECGVNGKWYHYIYVTLLYAIVLIVFMILFISLIGWVVIPLLDIDNCINSIHDSLYGRYIFLTKSDAIRSRQQEILKNSKGTQFTKEDNYFIPLNFPDSQWFCIVKESSYLRLDTDLSLNNLEIKKLKTWLESHGFNQTIYPNNRIITNVQHTHYTYKPDGLYIKVTNIDPRFFETEYGKKIKSTYKVYQQREYFQEPQKDSLEHVNCGEALNYGVNSIEISLNWSNKKFN